MYRGCERLGTVRVGSLDRNTHAIIYRNVTMAIATDGVLCCAEMYTDDDDDGDDDASARSTAQRNVAGQTTNQILQFSVQTWPAATRPAFR